MTLQEQTHEGRQPLSFKPISWREVGYKKPALRNHSGRRPETSLWHQDRTASWVFPLRGSLYIYCLLVSCAVCRNAVDAAAWRGSFDERWRQANNHMTDLRSRVSTSAFREDCSPAESVTENLPRDFSLALTELH